MTGWPHSRQLWYQQAAVPGSMEAKHRHGRSWHTFLVSCGAAMRSALKGTSAVPMKRPRCLLMTEAALANP